MVVRFDGSGVLRGCALSYTLFAQAPKELRREYVFLELYFYVVSAADEQRHGL